MRNYEKVWDLLFSRKYLLAYFRVRVSTIEIRLKKVCRQSVERRLAPAMRAPLVNKHTRQAELRSQNSGESATTASDAKPHLLTIHQPPASSSEIPNMPPYTIHLSTVWRRSMTPTSEDERPITLATSSIFRLAFFKVTF